MNDSTVCHSANQKAQSKLCPWVKESLTLETTEEDESGGGGDDDEDEKDSALRIHDGGHGDILKGFVTCAVGV